MAKVALAFGLLLFPIATAFAEPVSSPLVEEIVAPFVRSDKFAGVVLVQEGEKVTHFQAYGEAVREHAVPHKLDTVFRVGSISKQFTAALVLHLQDQGLLSVKDPLAEFFSVPTGWEGITLHHLLTHTAGLDHDLPFSAREFAAYHGSKELLAAAFASKISPDGPGKHYSYSNIGYTLLALVVEKALHKGGRAEKSYPEFFAKTFGALSLAQTSVDHASFVAPGMANGYIRMGSSLSRECCFDTLNLLGAGEIRSSALDLARWVDILVSGKFLSDEARKQFWAPQVAMENEGKPIKGFAYGYGWVVLDLGGRKVVLHNGSVPGFDADVAFLPEENKKIIVLSNVRYVNEKSGGLETVSSSIRDLIAARLFFGDPK